MFNRNLEFCYVCGKKFDTMQKSSPVSMIETYCPYCGALKIGEAAATILEHPQNPAFLGGNYNLVKLRSALFYHLRVELENYLSHEKAFDSAVIYALSDLKNFTVGEMSNPVKLEEVYARYPKNEEERLDAVMQLLATFLNEYGEKHFKSYQKATTDPNQTFDCLYMPASLNSKQEKELVLRVLEEKGWIMVENDHIAFTELGRHRAEKLGKKI